MMQDPSDITTATISVVDRNMTDNLQHLPLPLSDSLYLSLSPLRPSPPRRIRGSGPSMRRAASSGVPPGHRFATDMSSSSPTTACCPC